MIPGRTGKKHRGPIVAAAVFFGLAVFAAGWLPGRVVWITDNGAKLMMTRQFIETGSVFFPADDPLLFPRCGFHFVRVPGHGFASFHPPFLPVLTAAAVKVAGDFGTALIPMLCAAALAGLFCRFPLKGKGWLFASAAAAPFCFYAVLLWEMIPAALAVTLAAWLFARRRVTAAGAVFAAGLWMREELYLLGAVFVFVLLCSRRWREIRQFALGAALPLLALWAVNYALYGHIAGIHGAAYFTNNRPGGGAGAPVREILFNIHQHLLRFSPAPDRSPFFAPLAVLPALIAGAAPDYRAWKPLKIAAALIFTAAALILTVDLWKQQDLLFVSARTFGLFLSVPPLLGVMLHWRALCRDRRTETATAARAVMLYILTVPFLLNPHDVGLTWGARHFIVVMPLMLMLGVCAFGRSGCAASGFGRLTAGALCAAGIAMQCYALGALVKVSSDLENLQEEILALPPRTVISDLFFLPEMTPEVPFGKRQLEVTGSIQAAAARRRLEDAGERSFILLLSPTYRRIDDAALRELLREYPLKAPPEERVIGNSLKLYIGFCAK